MDPAFAIPAFAIILIVRHPAETPDAVLAALAAQIGPGEAEILLVDGRPDIPAGQAEYPGVTLIRAPGLNMPQLKARGALAARAPALVFLEPKAVPGPGWAAALRRTLAETPQAAFGGAVGFGGPPTPANQAAFSFEYAAFSPAQLAAGQTRDLPGNNMVLPRAALLTHCADILRAEGLNKPFCQARLLAAGVALRLIPDMGVVLTTQHRLGGLLRSRARYARCFGGTRVHLASPARRWIYRLGAPAVPGLVLVQQLRALRRADTGPRRPGTLPALVALCLAWAGGEITGYWIGPGDACKALY